MAELAELVEMILAVMRKRDENGDRHLHHRDCIHNLPPVEQVTARGKTSEWWLQVVGPLPEQISPDQWETEPPVWPWTKQTLLSSDEEDATESNGPRGFSIGDTQ